MSGVIGKLVSNGPWIATWALGRLRRRPPGGGPAHLIVALADHFEPAYRIERPPDYEPLDVQEARLERWCREYTRALDGWRDEDGRTFQRTYFYPAEQYHPSLLDRLAAHCADGWGEVEVHLHHGVERPDTAANTRRILEEFRDRLVGHGCLARWEGRGPARYAFVHGNWALANSGGGRACGVDDEMQILSDTGCYGDFTLPSAPDVSQTRKINSIYQCGRPLTERAPHRSGRDLAVGHPPTVWPIIVQGPSGLNFERRRRGLPAPQIENGGIMAAYPATMSRLRLWREAGVAVRGRPEWTFIKLHAHGMDPRDEAAMFGPPMRHFLERITRAAAEGAFHLHFVTAREMVNIALAACDGREGSPGTYRDYRLRLAAAS